MAVDMGFDEGGDQDTLILSAQVGIVAQSKKMHTRWKALIRKAELPFFHSIDYDNVTKGIFRHLSKNERSELLEALCGHLRKRMTVGLTVKMTLSNYKSKTDNEFRSRWAAAYPFCAEVLVSYANLVMQAFGLGDEINILIEDGHPNASQAVGIFERMKKSRDGGFAHLPMHILTVGLGSKADWPILQSADMLAYSEWQNLNGKRGDIYDQLHVKGSRYQVVYLDLDNDVMDEMLFIAKKSDASKALLSEFRKYERTKSQELLNDLNQRLREFRQDYEGTDGGSSQRDQGGTGSREGAENTSTEEAKG